ncbi:WD40-repeat-containing domain protein [Mycena floridula]|nr:WD40-repeat-containing domain protein [Mycena floridula]
MKRVTSRGGLIVSEDMKRQADGCLIRKGGVESQLDVVTLDLVRPKPRTEIKRSRSTLAAICDTRDRFITTRDRDETGTLNQVHHNPNSASPEHTARLIAANGVSVNHCILGYREPPPVPSSDITLAQQREFVKPLYARQTSRSRKIPTQPERVLLASELSDDFYLNLVSWSCQNAVAVGLVDATYIWKADTRSVLPLGKVSQGNWVASVEFSNDGIFLEIGTGTGDVELWDVEAGIQLRTMSGHQGQTASLSCHQHILSCGCSDGNIWHHDVRIQGTRSWNCWVIRSNFWRAVGNDNVVNIWDGRLGDMGEGAKGSAKWTKRNHTAVVKGLSWCPWQPNLLASGGGTNDGTINVWNTTTGARLHEVKTPAQITSVHWAHQKKEILTIHGYPTHAIIIIDSCLSEHGKILFSCIGPAGDVVCTVAGDDGLKFWRIWDLASENSGKKKSERRVNSTSSTALAIR